MLEIRMSETVAPRITAVEASPRVESRPSRDRVLKSLNNTLDGVQGLFAGYREEMAPLWDRLKRGDNLTPEERRGAIGYHITMKGVKNITGREPRSGEASWPDNLATDEWTNEYKDESGNLIGKQREGLRIKHLTGWLDKKIEQAREQGKPVVAFVLENSKADLEASSGTYAELHSSPGSLDIETRKRQEAGALIHASEETDEFGRQVRDSQISQDNEVNRAAHEREDWSFAEAELDGPNGEQGGALELVVPPPQAISEGTKIINPPIVRVDESQPTTRVNIPGYDGPPPLYVNGGGNGHVNQTIDLGGGEIVLPPGEINRTGVDVSERTIPEKLQGSGESESSPAEGSGALGDGGRRGEISSSVELPGENAEASSQDNTPTVGSEGMTARRAVDTIRRLGGSRIRESRFGPSDGVPPRVAPGFANEPGVRRGRYGELLPSEKGSAGTALDGEGGRGSGDASGTFYPEGDRSRDERSSRGVSIESSEGEEAKVGKRGERLAKIKGVAESIWKRVRGNNERVAAGDDWLASRVEPALDPRTPRSGVGKWVALALVVAAVVATCAKPTQPGAVSVPDMPGNKYPRTERIIDRPQPTSVAEADPSLAPAFSNPEVKTKRRSALSSKVEDFSSASGTQELTGLTQDQLAQLVDKAYAEEVKAARQSGGNVRAEEGKAALILGDIEAGFNERYGEKGQEVYKQYMDNLVTRQKDVIGLNNEGKIDINSDNTITWINPAGSKQIEVLDIGREEYNALISADRTVFPEHIQQTVPTIDELYNLGKKVNGR